MRCRGAIVAFVMLAQLGGGLRPGFPPTSAPSSPIDSALPSARPSLPPTPLAVPVAPAPSVTGGYVWVPNRIVPLPGEPGGLIVPGHWERQLNDRETYMPPLTATTPDGRVLTLPGGVVRTPQERQSP